MSKEKANAFHQKELEKDIEDIREDIFFRPDNFMEEKWYGDFMLFIRIGICETAKEDTSDVRKALKIMGYSTRAAEHDGKIYIVPDNVQEKASPQKDAER